MENSFMTQAWTRLMWQKTCPLLRCRKRFVNQCVRNSMINFEVSCHARNTLFVDEQSSALTITQQRLSVQLHLGTRRSNLSLTKNHCVVLLIWLSNIPSFLSASLHKGDLVIFSELSWKETWQNARTYMWWTDILCRRSFLTFPKSE